MMEPIHKTRILFWILIFLVVVNLSALATYFLVPGKPDVISCSGGPMAPGCALHSELNLTDDQIQLVDQINADYQGVSKPISEEIKGLRAKILDELASNTPDTLNLNKLSLEISRLQSQLHRENIRHYLELKKVCNPDQAMHLSNLYRDLYGCPMQEKGKETQHRHQRKAL